MTDIPSPRQCQLCGGPVPPQSPANRKFCDACRRVRASQAKTRYRDSEKARQYDRQYAADHKLQRHDYLKRRYHADVIRHREHVRRWKRLRAGLPDEPRPLHPPCVECGADMALYSLRRKRCDACHRPRTRRSCPRPDMIGQRFGRLVVETRTDRRSKGGFVIWSCRCDCGRVVEVPTGRLRSGNTRSCGCLRKK